MEFEKFLLILYALISYTRTLNETSFTNTVIPYTTGILPSVFLFTCILIALERKQKVNRRPVIM